MNNAKICVSVFSEDAESLIGMMRRAESVADVIELRFDVLDSENVRIAFEQLVSEKQILLTMRPTEQGGHSTRDLTSRIGFWMEYALHRNIDHGSIWIDHEYDLIPGKDLMFWVDQCFVVRSRHYLDGEIANLDKAYDTVVSEEEVGKIVVAVENAEDAVDVWKLLARAAKDGRRLTALAMGEAGKWTRILGPAHGAFMTYAALEPGGETAPGQLAAEDLTDIFRVRELDQDTAVYGIIAGKTDYSASPWMHNPAFRSAGLNAVFVPLQTNDLDSFMKRMVLPASREVELNFHGFSVTNPHKQAIIQYLDEVDEAAAKIGAVNTVKIENGKLYGYNTDAHGFISTLKHEYGELSGARVALFGAGGAARACAAALLDAGASVGIFARSEERGTALANEIDVPFEGRVGERKMADDFDIIVNATPLGTAGSNAEYCVLSGPELGGIKLVYDLVYNPPETTLIREAKAAGVPAVNGLGMMIEQGAKQFEIWTDQQAPVDIMRAGIEKRLSPS
ncbi:MAG: shikimate dehydrogenase [Acidobacteria bacterium]|nr:shikimate dehydrogenase [Acidobacteriota bacterium]